MQAPGDALIEGLAARGYAVDPAAIAGDLVTALRGRAHALDRAGAFAEAGIGRGKARERRADIRGDRIAWLGENGDDDAERRFEDWLEALRVRCNRELMLGVSGVEAHYAIYPPGACYERHRDRFRDDDARVVSCVLYLNDAWDASDGGALRMHTSDGVVDVPPQAGTFVAFLSGDVDHEVLAASRERLSIAGWLRRRVLV